MLIQGASAHGPRSGDIDITGSFLLGPTGSTNDSFHTFLSSLGLPVEAGDTLDFAWNANGGFGPQIYFDIHAHTATSGFVRFYNVTAAEDSGEWTVPGSEKYMVSWENPNEVAVNVSYGFGLHHPDPANQDYTPIVFLSSVGGIFVLLLWRGRRKRAAPAEESEE